MIVVKKVVVATDFSEPSDAALAYGRELARTFGARMLVTHVVDNSMTRAYGGDGFVFADPTLQEDVEAAARRQLEAVIAGDRAEIAIEAVILRSNTPAF